MGTSSSYKLAGLIALVVIGYFLIRGLLNAAGGGGDLAAGPGAGNVDNANGAEVFSVVVAPSTPQTWQQTVLVRGRTEAIRKVVVRAETTGVVTKTPTDIGSQVKAGDVLCRLQVDARQAQLNQAKAAIDKARIDFNAAKELRNEGFGSDTALATAKAALDLALANQRTAELALAQTLIRAPFDGVFDARDAEAGDLLRSGDACGTVIQQSPYLVVGAVSELDVSKISVGDTGIARLATGETIEGKVRFVARAADTATRTFDVELEIPNVDNQLRDGVTAEFNIQARRREAYLVKRSALILNDAGAIGLRTVNADNVVTFVPVSLLGDSAQGVWVSGPEGAINVITRGQEYVIAGQKVQIADLQSNQQAALYSIPRYKMIFADATLVGSNSSDQTY